MASGLYYSYVLGQDSQDILAEMAKEDHMSQATELEYIISMEYKRRQEKVNGYIVSIPAGSDVKDLKKELENAER